MYFSVSPAWTACESAVTLLFDAVMHLGCKPYLDSQRESCVCQYEIKRELWRHPAENAGRAANTCTTPASERQQMTFVFNTTRSSQGLTLLDFNCGNKKTLIFRVLKCEMTGGQLQYFMLVDYLCSEYCLVWMSSWTKISCFVRSQYRQFFVRFIVFKMYLFKRLVFVNQYSKNKNAQEVAQQLSLICCTNKQVKKTYVMGFLKVIFYTWRWKANIS